MKLQNNGKNLEKLIKIGEKFVKIGEKCKSQKKIGKNRLKVVNIGEKCEDPRNLVNIGKFGENGENQ